MYFVLYIVILAYYILHSSYVFLLLVHMMQINILKMKKMSRMNTYIARADGSGDAQR